MEGWEKRAITFTQVRHKMSSFPVTPEIPKSFSLTIIKVVVAADHKLVWNHYKGEEG